MGIFRAECVLMAASSQVDCSTAAKTLPLLALAYEQKGLLLECSVCAPIRWLHLLSSQEKLICALGKEHTKMNATPSDDIVAIAQEAMQQNDLQAVILSVSIGNQNIVTTALGQSMTGVPATTGMHFRIGSVSFAYLATVLLQLVDQKRVRLDDKLSTWLPALPHAESITLRMLPENRSGYADYVKLLATTFDVNPFRAWSPQELLQPALAEPLQNLPGEGFTYAHTNFGILAMALQQITGQSAATLVQERILAPLGLHNTASSLTAEIRPPVLHAFDSERGLYEESSFWNPSWTTASDAVMTSDIEDVRKSAIAVGEGTLLSAASHQEQIAPVSLISPPGQPEAYYGIGVFVVNSWVLQNPLFSGYNALMAYLPSKKIAMAVTTTLGPKSSSSTNYSTQIFQSIGTYLASNHQPV
jgi:CubicO group peptidase (beta-lactamase class C family)